MSDKIIFMGSPDFSVPVLEMLHLNYNLIGVVTQPDRRAGRGNTIRMSAVKQTALDYGIPIYQPERLKTDEQILPVRELNPDLIIVAAFGQILRNNVLNLPRLGCVNVHASLLPRWRGAAPINAAIVHGDAETGVTIMQMDKGIDTGDMLAKRSIPIETKETAGSLSDKLSVLGAELLHDTLPAILDETIDMEQQDESLATYVSMMKKSDGLLDFHKTAEELERKVRGYSPWPGTFMVFEGENLKIHEAEYIPGKCKSPGKRRICDGFPCVETSDGILKLNIVQPPGKKRMQGNAFLNGARNWRME